MESIKCGTPIRRTAYPKRCPGFGPIDSVTTLSPGITVGPVSLQMKFNKKHLRLVNPSKNQ